MVFFINYKLLQFFGIVIIEKYIMNPEDDKKQKQKENYNVEKDRYVSEELQAVRLYTTYRSYFTGQSGKFEMLCNAQFSDEALNFVFIEGTAFMANFMCFRHIFLAELYDGLLRKLKACKIKFPFRLFQLKIDKLTQYGFRKCSENFKQTILSDIKRQYPGPIILAGYSSGFNYCLQILRDMYNQIQHLIIIAPVVNFTVNESIWQKRLQNKQRWLQLGKKDLVSFEICKFVREQIINKQNERIEDKVATQDHRISPIFSTETQVECFKNVNFHLILAEKDGLISQQIAFKTMLDAYKIPSTLKVCPGMTHAMGFFRVPLNMDDQNANKIIMKKYSLVDRVHQIMLSAGKQYNLVTNLVMGFL